ncbi:peptidylprolyl isomerase [Candidatus Woesearchaeota archaeon]|nr:peptidylprolyl isomerase [Candidatus Woesearchaeota archaeon]
MSIKKGDFVEIEYTGKTQDGFIFDTTSEETARQNNIFNERYTYGPVIICIGEAQVLKGIDKQLEGKSEGSFTADIQADDAFGRKSAKLLRMIPLSAFKKQNIMPHPGLQLNMDGVIGTVKTVQGGRTIVDFNHPLASKDLVYDLKVNRIVTDDVEKIKSYVQLQLSQKGIQVKVEGSEVAVALQFPIPKEYTDKVAAKLKELTGKEVTFHEPKAEEPKEAKDAQIQEGAESNK